MRAWLDLPKVSQISLLVTAFTAFSCILGIDIHTPSLPNMVSFFHTTNDIMQLAVTLFVVGAGIGIIFWGPLSDRYGRRPIIVIGVSIVTLSSAIAAISTDIYIFLLLRLIQGFGSGAAMCLSRVIAADLLDKKQLAIIGSTIGLITGMAPMLAPIIGGYIEESVGWYGSFVLYAFITSFSLVLFLSFYTESKVCEPNARLFSQYAQLLAAPRFMLFGLLQGVVLSVINCYAVIAPFLIQVELGETPIFFGWVSGFCALCQLFSKLCTPFGIQKLGAYQIHVIGWVVLAISGGVLLTRFIYFPLSTELFITAIGLAFSSIHMIIPYQFSEAMTVSSAGKGTLGAGFSATGMIFSFVLSSIIAYIPYEGSGLLGGYYLLLAIIGSILSIITRR
jgi:MFS family permease